MKKVFLFALFLSLSTTSFAQNVLRLFNKANEFFTYMEQQKFDTAHQYFDVSEQSKVSPANLQQLWTNITTNLGGIKSLEAIQSKTQGEFYAVTVEGKFEKNDQNFILLFNKAEKLAGLYMPKSAPVYAKPLYADTNLYTEKEVYIQTPGHQLAAMVTTPKNATNFPIVVLVHGPGPSDMDETISANKPFKDLAYGLAAKGIATLRYVKRTLVYQNEFTGAFTVKEEITDDAVAAIAMAKTINGADPKNIYVFGHSLGGMVTPRIATLTPDVKGIILAAAPARKLTDLVLDQNNYIYELAKDTTEAGKKQLADAAIEVEKSRISKLGNIKPDSVIIGLPSAYWVDLNSYDQVATAKKLNKRIYIVQGGNDFQIFEKDYNLWNTALGKKSNVTFKFYPELNHLFSVQTEKGNARQYLTPANVSEQFIADLSVWIKTKQ